MKLQFQIFVLFQILVIPAFGQKKMDLTNLKSFKNPSQSWSIVKEAIGNYDSKELTSSPGTGVLINTPNGPKYQSQDNLLFDFVHGDINISFNFMLPKGSNSGIYLQGRYELQLYDSWGVKVPKVHDLGAIYERWDESRGKGKEGYEGHAPRVNAAFAPGLWQHYDIEFRTARYDKNGKKISNAKFVKVVLNGALIHENVEMLDVTRGAIYKEDATFRPIQIQGDHGPVAFKNINYELLEKEPIKINKLNYTYFEETLKEMPKQLPLKSVSKGELSKIDFNVGAKNNNFLLAFEGNFTAPEADSYTFITKLTGNAILKIDGKTVIDIPPTIWRHDAATQAELALTKGEHTFSLWYMKEISWGKRALGLFVKRQGAQLQSLHAYNSFPDPDPVPEITLNAKSKPEIQRSFVLFDGVKRTHAINVGSTTGVNFSYDLDRAALLKIWKGPFLNTTEMWFDRGEPQLGTPIGAAIALDGKNVLGTPQNNNEILDSLSVENEWIYKGYNFDINKNPIFKYNYKSIDIYDILKPSDDGKALERTISFSSPMLGAIIRLGEADNIVSLNNGLYLVGNHYIKLANNEQAIIKPIKKGFILMRPVLSNSISYSIIW